MLIFKYLEYLYTNNNKIKIIPSYICELKYLKGLYLSGNQINDIKSLIYNVVHHPQLTMYFKDDVVIYNEREIVTTDNQIIIPDRLVFDTTNNVTIIDYKTGVELQKHHQQIINYAQVLEFMNFKVGKKLLIYVNKSIDIVEV